MNEIIELLHKYNIRPNKNLGQNFLIDDFVVEKILEASGPSEDECVLEIGPGVGSLTRRLLEGYGKVIALEIDENMCRILAQEYGGNERLTIVNANALKTNISRMAAEEHGLKVCANLPYYITTPIIMHLLENTEGVTRMTLMMQKEVGDRILARPGTKEYGAITPAIWYHAEVSMVANVPQNCFIPRPSVQSVVLNFDVLEKKRVAPVDERLMFQIIRASFGQRRKTMLNAISNQLLPTMGISKDALIACFETAGLAPGVRGETLGLEEFCRLSDAIAGKREEK